MGVYRIYRFPMCRTCLCYMGVPQVSVAWSSGPDNGVVCCGNGCWKYAVLGVACSFIRRVRALDLSYDVGMYLIYIFSITIASMADLSNLDLAGGINQLAFMTVAVFLSLMIHAVVCRFMRVDADSMMISSVAFINSPPFVPMASAAMQNKRALVTGLGAGIVGYAAGTHLGVLMAELLSHL